MKNALYYGDNINILREYIEKLIIEKLTVG